MLPSDNTVYLVGESILLTQFRRLFMMDSDELNSKVFQMMQERSKQDLDSKFRAAQQVITNPKASNEIKSTAYYDLYLLHRHGWGGAKQDERRAGEYLKLSADLDNNNTRAQNDLRRFSVSAN